MQYFTHTYTMESVKQDNSIQLRSKMIVPFVIGVVMCIITVILFFVGAFRVSPALWIATAVTGGLTVLFLIFSSHSTDGWVRMFSIAFIVAMVIILTYMATVTWA